MAVAIDSRVRQRLERTVASAKSEGSVNTVREWRGRSAALGPDGLRDAERSGRPKMYGPEVPRGDRGHSTRQPPPLAPLRLLLVPWAWVRSGARMVVLRAV